MWQLQLSNAVGCKCIAFARHDQAGNTARIGCYLAKKPYLGLAQEYIGAAPLLDPVPLFGKPVKPWELVEANIPSKCGEAAPPQKLVVGTSITPRIVKAELVCGRLHLPYAI